MYEMFYLTMLISAILLGAIILIGRRFTKLRGYMMSGLMVICIVSLMGFVVTTSMI